MKRELSSRRITGKLLLCFLRTPYFGRMSNGGHEARLALDELLHEASVPSCSLVTLTA